MAACLAAIWQGRFPGHRVRSVGYATPCVFSLTTARQLDDIIMTVETEGDISSTMSLGHATDDKKVLSILCQDKELREEILSRTQGGYRNNMSKEDYEWCVEAMACFRKERTSKKLLPPGKVYQIAGPFFGSGEETTTIQSVDSMIFNERKYHARVLDLSLHLPARYERVLQRLASLKQGEGSTSH